MSRIDGGLGRAQLPISRPEPPAKPGAAAGDFGASLQDALQQVRGAMDGADAATAKALVGEGQPHDATLALTKADLAFRFVVQVRSKAVEAYKEMMHLNM